MGQSRLTDLSPLHIHMADCENVKIIDLFAKNKRCREFVI